MCFFFKQKTAYELRISDWSSDVCSSGLPGTTLESLAKLKPAFEGFGKGGFEAVAKDRYPEIEELRYVHHGGNSSGVVDGAGLVLVGSKQFGEKAGLKPRARIRAYANIGSEPTIMLTAPAAVSQKDR